MTPEIDNLENLVKQIDALPQLNDYLLEENEELWLQARRIASNGLDAPNEVRTMMRDLGRLVQRLLIDEVGRHDGFMWELLMHGYRIERAGIDRKGFVYSALVTPYKKWRVSFG